MKNRIESNRSEMLLPLSEMALIRLKLNPLLAFNVRMKLETSSFYLAKIAIYVRNVTKRLKRTSSNVIDAKQRLKV